MDGEYQQSPEMGLDRATESHAPEERDGTRASAEPADPRGGERKTAQYCDPFFETYTVLVAVCLAIERRHPEAFGEPLVDTDALEPGDLLQEQNVGPFDLHKTGKGLEPLRQEPAARPIVPEVCAYDGDRRAF